MRPIVLLLLAFAGLSFAYGNVVNVVFEIDKNNTILLGDLSVDLGEPTRFPESSGSYSIIIADAYGRSLASYAFEPSFFLFSDPIILKNTSLIGRRLEYNGDADRLLIKHEDKVIFQKKLPRKTQCNDDATCSAFENAFSCSPECSASSQDAYCTAYSDGVCDPDCGVSEDSDCKSDAGGGDTARPCCTPSFVLILLCSVFWSGNQLKH